MLYVEFLREIATIIMLVTLAAIAGKGSLQKLSYFLYSFAVSRYLFTIFGYGCNLGAAQTARHAQGEITLRVLKRINDQHITTENLEAALRDVINEYIRFDLSFLWGNLFI